MENLSSEIVGIIYQLLPGFISACIFYVFTSYLKPAPFERIIQALIFTALTKALLILTKSVFFISERFISLGEWSSNKEFVLSIVFAVLLGIGLSWCVINDFPLWVFRKDGPQRCKNPCTRFVVKILSKLNLTNKALYPSEWYSFFKNSEYYAVLHLDGERRLKGYLWQFPDSPESGHFIVIDPSWLLDDGTIVPVVSVEKVLISSTEVLRVELIKWNIESNINDVEKSYGKIYSLYNEKENSCVN
ncbi:hypothetical protein QA601_15350 [Chitinispirillales bacterium ANBcel5]|uniref:hypothetical protein n=1 Tax=Cellulosispirillum alkaliphilum TaxID=3039283 RepID=UPI002A52E289|nr:hypothetical protein [Chitinispirillales bacterium ANBcel5]